MPDASPPAVSPKSVATAAARAKCPMGTATASRERWTATTPIRPSAALPSGPAPAPAGQASNGVWTAPGPSAPRPKPVSAPRVRHRASSTAACAARNDRSAAKACGSTRELAPARASALPARWIRARRAAAAARNSGCVGPIANGARRSVSAGAAAIARRARSRHGPLIAETAAAEPRRERVPGLAPGATGSMALAPAKESARQERRAQVVTRAQRERPPRAAKRHAALHAPGERANWLLEPRVYPVAAPTSNVAPPREVSTLR